MITPTPPFDRNADSIGRLDLVLSGLSWRALYLRFDKNGQPVIRIAQDYGSEGWGFESLRARKA
jgi:hypothetical protein